MAKRKSGKLKKRYTASKCQLHHSQKQVEVLQEELRQALKSCIGSKKTKSETDIPKVVHIGQRELLPYEYYIIKKNGGQATPLEIEQGIRDIMPFSQKFLGSEYPQGTPSAGEKKLHKAVSIIYAQSEEKYPGMLERIGSRPNTQYKLTSEGKSFATNLAPMIKHTIRIMEKSDIELAVHSVKD